MPIAPGGPIVASAFAQDSFHGDAVQDTVALTELLPAERFDKQERFVEDDNETYYFDLQSTAASSPPDILVPDDSPAAGRWIKLSPSGGVPATHAATHPRAGTDEIDGDKLDIDFTPANYTPDTSPAEVTNVDELTAHLKGIDDQLTGGITLPVVDTTSIVEGSADATKEMRIEVDGLTTATVRVATMPDKDILWDDAGDARTPTTHSLGGAEHAADTLANLNSKITDATLIDTGDARLSDARTPLAHRASHISGGGDAFLSTDLLEATIKRVLESGGPTTLTVGVVVDGEFLKRVGSTIVSAVAGGDTLPVVDTTAIVKGSGDATKLVRIEADGLTTATTRTLTMPDANITPDDVGGRRGVDATIALVGEWGVGGFQITELGGLDPFGTGSRDLGTASVVWRTGWIREIRPGPSANMNFTSSVGKTVLRFDQFDAVIVNPDNFDVNFRVAGDTDPVLLTTDAGLEMVGVGVALGAHLAKFHVNQTSSTTAVLIVQNGTGRSLEIDSSATSQPVLNFDNPLSTSGNVIDVDDADALTTGSIANYKSNSTSVSARSLIKVINDNSLAVGCLCLDMRQDALKEVMGMDLGLLDVGFIDFKAAADADAVSAISTLTTSGAIQGHVQIEVNGVSRWFAFLADPS